MHTDVHTRLCHEKIVVDDRNVIFCDLDIYSTGALIIDMHTARTSCG